jgi:hypothetical protein
MSEPKGRSEGGWGGGRGTEKRQARNERRSDEGTSRLQKGPEASGKELS